MTRQDSPTPHCLDGETLAAWSSGSLRASEAATVEEHLSNCERCQSMLATFVRIEPPPAAPAPVWRRWHLAWLVPVATAATITAIWVAIPTERRDLRQESARFEARLPDVAQPQEQPQAPSPRQLTGPPAAAPLPDARAPAAPPPARKREASGERALSTDNNESLLMKQRRRESEEVAEKRDARDADRRATDSLGAAAASSPAPTAVGPPQAAAPPAPPTALERRDESGARSAREEVAVTRRSALLGANAALIVSPDPAYRWRILGDQVDRSSTGGEQWQRVAIPDSARLTAGHSPSASVAWLVGPAGTIYVTTDGTRFEKVPFIEPIDLVAVVAIDDRQATITAADGRLFRTMDRGVTWARVP